MLDDSGGEDGDSSEQEDDSEEDLEEETERAKRELAEIPFGVLQVLACVFEYAIDLFTSQHAFPPEYGPISL